MPLFRSRHNPQEQVQGKHHAQKPSSVSVVSLQSPVVRDNRRRIPTREAKNDPVLDHLAQHHRLRPPRSTRGQWPTGGLHTTDVSEHICHDRWRTRPARETLEQHRPHPVRLATAARPETHQNLIHSNKDQTPGLDPGVMPQTNPGPRQRHRHTIHRPSRRNNLPRNNPGNTEPHASPRSHQWAGQHQPPQHHPKTQELPEL